MSHKRSVLATHPNPIFSQFEDSDLDYTINYIGRLGSDTIATSVWELENGSGLTISGESNDSTTVTARITGDNGRYLITNTITLSTGETMQSQIQVIIKRNDMSIISDYRDRGIFHG